MFDAWLPPKWQPAVEWIPANIVMPSDTETPGPFDLDQFPHVLGVLEAAEDPTVRQILLPWATRNAKTKTCVSLMIWLCTTMPRPGLVVGPDEDTADALVADHYYPLLEESAATRTQLLPTHKRNKKFVSLTRSRIRRGFAGSPSTLAGFPACYGHFAEVSKPQKASTEADAVKLVLERGKLYPFESKFLFESSPGTKGACRITELCEAPTTERRRRWVPCPHCGQFQLLRLGDKKSRGGLRWETPALGHSDIMLAEQTAYYECERCQKPIRNMDRPGMMRAGVWLPEGQTIDKERRIHGEPRIKSSTVAFGPLSSLYSLAISGWGQIARDFLEAVAIGKEGLRAFYNGTLGLVWDPTPTRIDHGDVAARMCTKDRRGIVPSWGRFLTAAVDVQGDGTFFPWQVCAWGRGGRGAVVDYGTYQESLAEVLPLLAREFVHAAGGTLKIALAGIDSGDETRMIYDFCRGKPLLLPMKGMNHWMKGDYRLEKLDDKRTRLLEINTDSTNEWLQRFLEGRQGPEADGWFSFPEEVSIDFAFIDECLNEQPFDEVDRHGRRVKTWKKRTSGQPNDQRDLIRYNRAIAQLITVHGTRWDAVPERTLNAPAGPAAVPEEADDAESESSFIRKPGPGWLDR